MADRYVFKLSVDNFSIVVVDELGPINTWSTDPVNVCLLFESGIVDASENRIICHTGPADNATVLILHSASWSSDVGDTGEVAIELGDGCETTQQWTLVEKS